MSYLDAAVEGARDVAIPITFSILTNIIAFLPMAFVPGVMGKVWRVIPVVVIVVFLISWVESLYILPSHLAHSKESGKGSIAGSIHRFQQKFANLLLRFINNVYGPILDRILSVRYLAVIVLMAVLVVTVAYVKSGRIRMILSPRVESDRAVVTATLPYGSPLSEMVRVRERLIAGIDEVAKNNGGTDLLDGTFALIDDNEVEVNAYLTSPDIRPLSTGDVTQAWRKATGSIIGLSSIRYESDRGGPGGGAAIAIELRHRDSHVLDEASIILAERLEEFSSSKDVDSGYSAGKIQFNYQVNPWGESLGLTSSEIGRQIRNSFQGAIALRQQRGNNEVTVRIRLPKGERSNQYSLENLLIQTPALTYVPLAEVATLEKNRAYTTISRNNARRTITVSANVDPIGDAPIIIATLDETILPELAQKYPGLSYGYSGRQADRKESVSKLLVGFLFALGGIYFLLAIPFRSYIQPIVVMIAIPFGVIGAVFGHMIMNYNLSLMSMMGIVALSGVVVNDSLVLVDYANKQKRKGTHSFEAIKTAGLRRFRPVMLTTLTTFGGLAPMIFETSRQARFMIPMAISLGFGILFATIVTLALVPCLYLIIDDCKKSVARLF
jgi:multidrug efflux pump subunit AcrB